MELATKSWLYTPQNSRIGVSPSITVYFNNFDSIFFSERVTMLQNFVYK